MPDGLGWDQARGIHSTTDTNTYNKSTRTQYIQYKRRMRLTHIHTKQPHTCTTPIAECGHHERITRSAKHWGVWSFIAGRPDSAVNRSRNARRIEVGPGKKHTFNHRHIQQKHANSIHPIQAPNAAHTSIHNKHTHAQIHSPNAATTNE